ncbi:MAG: hypothetical protein QNJ34_02930 [Xenococcaceae cyanobacterium MO_188.B29]|nr:hypothetical protein [Xenococcaceae cyanobacterium MO_188.B29]
MRIGILSLLFSIISNYTEIAYRQSYLQAQGALESIQVLKAAEKYPDCLQQVETFPQSYSDLETEVENLLQECQQGQAKEELAEARKLAEQSKFKEAILIAAQVPADTNVYFEAQKLIEQWSEKIFLIASNQYQEGKLIQAIALMGNIPAGSSWAEKAEATIQQWNQDWQQNQIYIQSAQKAMDAGHWKKAIKMANKVSHTYYWQKQSNLIIQTAKAKIASAQVADSTRTRKYRSRSTLPRPKLIPRSRLTKWICLNNPNPKCNK